MRCTVPTQWSDSGLYIPLPIKDKIAVLMIIQGVALYRHMKDLEIEVIHSVTEVF